MQNRAPADARAPLHSRVANAHARENTQLVMADAERAPLFLVAACGLPASGKSTLADAICEVAAKGGHSCTHVKFDSFEHRALADNDGAFDPAAWHDARRAAFDAVRDAAATSSVVIVDDVLQLSGMRRHVVRVAESLGAAHAQLCVSCAPGERRARNDARSGVARVPAEAVARLELSWEDPRTSPHGFDTARTVHVDATSPVDASDVWSRLAAHWGAPAVHPSELARRRLAVARAATASSFLHQLDLGQKARVRELLSSCAPSERSVLAARLSSARRDALRRAGSLFAVGLAAEAVAASLEFG